jgi:hypothetical protein
VEQPEKTSAVQADRIITITFITSIAKSKPKEAGTIE